MEVTPEHNGAFLVYLCHLFVCFLLFCCIIQEHKTSPDIVLVLLPELRLHAWSLLVLEGCSVGFLRISSGRGWDRYLLVVLTWPGAYLC